MSINPINIIKILKQLYLLGESLPLKELEYLKVKGLLIKGEELIWISPSWADLSHQLNEEELMKVLLAIHPRILTLLLGNAKELANQIASKNDKNEIFNFVDTLPVLAKDMINLKKNENEQKDAFNFLFNGTVSYSPLLRLLSQIQLIKEIESSEVPDLALEPDKNWIPGRFVSTQYSTIPQKTVNRKILTVLEIDNNDLDPEMRGIISHPWETFLVVLGMLLVEYSVDDADGFSLRPENPKQALIKQNLLVYLISPGGKIKAYGGASEFASEICSKLGIILFPDEKPQIEAALFELLKNGIFEYNGTEFRLHSTWEDRIYNRERLLKNKSRKLRDRIKMIIEKMRREI